MAGASANCVIAEWCRSVAHAYASGWLLTSNPKDSFSEKRNHQLVF
jgi:hypothetical protein